MNLSKKAKLMGFLVVILLQVAPQAFASPENDLAREKTIVENILKEKFSYNGNVNGSYGFMGKLIDPEDIEAHKDLAAILKKITYPRTLAAYESLYISTESDTSARAFEKNKSLMIIGKKLDPIQVIKLFSINPNQENSLKGLIKIKLENSSNILSAHLGPELLEALMSIVNIRCNLQIKDIIGTKLALEDQGYELFIKEPLDLSKLPEAHRILYADLLKRAQAAEKMTLRFHSAIVDTISLLFQKDNLAINLASSVEGQTVALDLSATCEYENLMIRTHENEIVKKVLHFDKDLNITKKVLNQQTRIEGKNQKRNTTTVATLDSGLDYNHPSVIESLLQSSLDSSESKMYEASKKDFINDLDIKDTLNKKRKKIVLDIESSALAKERAATRVADLIIEKNKLLHNIENMIAEQTKLSRLQNINQGSVKQLEADKLITFKPAKQSQLRSLKSKVASLKFEIESLKTEIDNTNNRITNGEKYIISATNNNKIVIDRHNLNLSSLSSLSLEEVAHEKMLDIFTRGVTAWNFYDDNDTPSDFWDGASSVLFSRYDHGTHVAGIILNEAESELSIFPMRYPKQPQVDMGNLKEKKVYQAVELAYKKGIRVLNISMGTFAPESKNAQEKIINDKDARGSWRSIEKAATDFPDMLFVCAAGNDGKNTDERGHYPSSFEASNILSIAAVDKNNKLAEFSNYGKRTVDFAAPGVEIISLVPNGEIGIKSGTSMATPFVSRVAGRIENINSALTPEQIKEIIASTLKKTKELEEKTLYGGAIDEDRAIAKACTTISASQRAHKLACKNK